MLLEFLRHLLESLQPFSHFHKIHITLSSLTRIGIVRHVCKKSILMLAEKASEEMQVLGNTCLVFQMYERCTGERMNNAACVDVYAEQFATVCTQQSEDSGSSWVRRIFCGRIRV